MGNLGKHFGGTVIDSLEYLKKIYACKNKVRFPNQQAFLEGLFLAVNSNYFTAVTNETAKKVFQVGGGIRPTYKTTVVNPKVENVYSFFKKAIDPTKIDKLANEFGLVPETVSEELLIWSISYEFLDFLAVTGDTSTKDVRDYYLDKKSDNAFITNQGVVGDESIFLVETSNHCCLCGNSKELSFIDKDGIPRKRFRLTKIFPDHLPDETPFAAIKAKPSDLNSYENNIALCHEHAFEYLDNPTTTTYERLLKEKAKMIKYTKAREELASVDVTKEIEDVLNYLLLLREPASVDLSLDPKVVETKMRESSIIVIDSIKDLNTKYFKGIDKFLSKFEAKSTDGSTVLGMKIKTMSMELVRNGFTPEEVFDELSKQIKDKTHCSTDLVCKIIIAYFIQHCEVLG